MSTSDLERLTSTLLEAYSRVWADVQAEETRLLADFTQANRSQKLRRLRDTRRTIEGLMDVADELALRWAFRDLPDAYQLGARQAAGAVGSAVSFTQVDVDAVNSLALDSRQSLLDATSGVKRSTKALINRLATEHMTAKLVRGQTAEQAGKALATELEGHGITSVVYRDGSRHGLAEYAQMAVQTRTAEAYQVGGFEQTAALGIDWVEIFDGIGCVAPETKFVPYGDLVQVARAKFSGRAYRITARTPAGTNALTVGPNHPVLTDRGWVRAHLLTEQDQLVYDTRLESPHVRAELDLEEVPAVEDVFASAAQRFPVTVRATHGGDLHGDAVFCEQEVEVVRTAGVLLLEGQVPLEQHVLEPQLVLADLALGAPAGGGHAGSLVGRVLPAGGFVGSRGPSSPFLRGCPPVPASQSLAAVEGDAGPVERRVDRAGLEVQPFGDLPGRQALVDVEAGHLVDGQARGAGADAAAEPALGVVAGVELGVARLAGGDPGAAPVELAHGLVFCRIESIVSLTTDIVVFDATTTTGAFNAEGFVVKNCGLASHDDPRKANGLILTLDEARLYPLSHPRCGRATSPRPDIASKRDAEHARPSTTPEQRADQAAAEARRTESVAAAAHRRRLDAQVQRRSDGILSDAGNRVTSPAGARAMARREARARRAGRRTA